MSDSTNVLKACAIASLLAVFISLVTVVGVVAVFRLDNTEDRFPLAAGPATASGYPGTSRTISVSGRAEQRIAPDLATLTLSVKTVKRLPLDAQRENEQLSGKVIAALKDAGAVSKEINPSGLVIEETSHTEELEDGRSVTVPDVIVTSEVVVRTKSLDRVRALLSSAFAAGATNGRIEFSTTKLRQLRDDARDEAIKAAVEKAGALTKGAGARRGQVLSISEDNFRYWGMESQNAANSIQNSQQSPSAATPDEMSDQFGGGMITVSATVSATFAIES